MSHVAACSTGILIRSRLATKWAASMNTFSVFTGLVRFGQASQIRVIFASYSKAMEAVGVIDGLCAEISGVSVREELKELLTSTGTYTLTRACVLIPS